MACAHQGSAWVGGIHFSAKEKDEASPRSLGARNSRSPRVHAVLPESAFLRDFAGGRRLSFQVAAGGKVPLPGLVSSVQPGCAFRACRMHGHNREPDMQKTWKLRWSSAACAGLLVMTTAAVTFDDIEFWVGSGTNRAALVIDWADGLSPESLLWGYQWNGQATGLDMLLAVVRADSRLFAHLGQYAWGTAVFGLGYDLNGNGIFSVSPAPGFDAQGVAWSLSPNDARTAEDPGDHWREGWNTGYWAYYVKAAWDSPWASSMVGAADRTLSAGAWDGWRFAPGFAGAPPGVPVPAPVPEASAWSLLLLGGGLLAWARRRSSP